MKKTPATISEIANTAQSVLGLAAQLRHGVATDADLAVRLESEIARLVRAVRRLQPARRKP
jgi:hypothetical protein